MKNMLNWKWDKCNFIHSNILTVWHWKKNEDILKHRFYNFISPIDQELCEMRNMKLIIFSNDLENNLIFVKK